MYKRGDNIMEKGLKWLFGGLIAAVVMMFLLMASSVKADGYCPWDISQGQHMFYMHQGNPIYPPSILIPQTDNRMMKTETSQNFIHNSVTRDNTFRPNVTVNTPKPQR
jgi:hypothetical protein